MSKLFGTDGIRGIANVYPMTVEMAVAIGRAIGFICKRHDKRHRIVIGKDTRLSGYMLENALTAGICSMGVDVYLLGPVPTPATAYITQNMRADAGIVISASHNPYDDNGIKIFTRDGYKLSYKIAPIIFREMGAEVIALHSSPNGMNINENCGSRHTEDLRRAVVESKADAGLAFDGDGDRLITCDEQGCEIDQTRVCLDIRPSQEHFTLPLMEAPATPAPVSRGTGAVPVFIERDFRLARGGCKRLDGMTAFHVKERRICLSLYLRTN
jgi:phosphomannomutase